MVENEEKIVPEAEETKAEETVETKEEVAEAAAEETKEEKAAKPKKKGGLIALIAVAAVVVIAAVVFVVLMMTQGNNALAAHKAGDFKAAYEASQSALFLDGASKKTIAQDYVKSLTDKGNYYQAKAVIDAASVFSQEEKDAIIKGDANFAFCVKGTEVTYAKYDQDGDMATDEDLKWIVLDVVEENGKAKALIMTKDIVGFAEGYNKGTDTKNSLYSKSEVNSWCEKEFYSALKMHLRGAKVVAANTKVATVVGEATDEVNAHAFILSKEEAQKYLAGDFAQYAKAKASATAEEAGVAVTADQFGGYFLRTPGAKDKDMCAVNRDGAVIDNAAKGNGTLKLGLRPCMWVELGEI